MFTGIITAIGQIAEIHDLGSSSTHGKRLILQINDQYLNYLDDVVLGDSIALNGACMTVVDLSRDNNRFSIDISAESLSKTSVFTRDHAINLEKALRAQDRLGGHLVSGHVDGVGRITHFEPIGESFELRVLAPTDLSKFLAYKGSITINGVSLTINQINDLPEGCEISINLIPHTLENTALNMLKVNHSVNLEIDLLARYCERMLQTMQR